MPVINKVKYFIDKLDISTYEFGKRSGVSLTTAYALYHNPEQLPSSTVLKKICDAFRIQPNVVLEWIPPEGVISDQQENDRATNPSEEMESQELTS